MKNIKKMLALMLVLCLTSCLLVIPASADTCCTVSIASVEQASDKLTVNWYAESGMGERTARVRIYHQVDNSGSMITEQSYTISSSESTAMVTEFDSANFITGEQYSVSISYDGYCSNCQDYDCNANKNFYAEYGSPVYELGNTFSESITITPSPITFKVTATKNGIYDLFVDCENDWCLDIMATATLGNFSNLVYLKENESKYYQVKIADYATDVIQSCEAKFKADLADIETVNASTATPANGDLVFSMTDLEGVAKLEISKDGQYEILTECGNNGEVILLNTEGEKAASQKFNQAGKHILNAGTYYYLAFPWSLPTESYTTTIKYYEIETMQFGDEISSDSYDDKYLTFKLDKMAAVWAENKSGYLNMQARSGDKNFYIADYVQILPAGEYTLTYSGYGCVVINKTDIPTVVIGNEITAYEYQGSSYVILQAPETGEYEFYTSYNGAVIDGEWFDSGYYYITMQAGETKSFEYYHDYGTITARKHTKEYTPISIGEKTDFDIAIGQRKGFSFTADADDVYILSLSDDYTYGAYVNSIKVYTDKKVLYEGEDEDFKELIIELNEGETVYTYICNGDYERAYTVNITKPRITEDMVVDCSNPTWSSAGQTFVFTPSAAGYYNFTVNNLIGDTHAYIKVSIDGEDVGEISSQHSSSVSRIIYASYDEPLIINLTYGTGQTAQATLTFDKIESKPIENISDFEITDNSYYSFTLPETGVYKITGSAFYNTSSWREEGVYTYFFDPIIKNCKETSFSYDAQEGEVPVYFCGSKGDEVLFKEEVTSPYYPFEYPITASISKVDTEEIQLDSLVSSSESCKLYSVNITKDGVYKFEDFSDELFDINGTYYGTGFTYFYDGSGWICVTDLVRYEDLENVTFELNAGTYYIAAATRDKYSDDEYIPAAKFKISKVNTGTPDDEALQVSGSKTANGVNYTISGGVPADSTLYAALYEGEKMKELKPVKNPLSSGSITFDNATDSYNCKLFLWDATLNPLCSDAACE